MDNKVNKKYIERQQVLKILDKLSNKLDNYFESFDVYCDYYEDDEEKESVRVNKALAKLIFNALKQIEKEVKE